MESAAMGGDWGVTVEPESEEPDVPFLSELEEAGDGD